LTWKEKQNDDLTAKNFRHEIFFDWVR